jgi:cytochrome b
MNTTVSPLPPTPPTPTAPAASPRRRLLIDAPTRVFHWLLAASFAGAYLTGEGERWRLVHITLGYTLAGLIGFRLVWGLIGPPQTRWSAQWRKLRALPEVWRGWRAGRPNMLQTQHVANTLAIWALLLLSVLSAANGYATYAEIGGEWMAEFHEFTANAALATVFGHLGLIIVSSVLRQTNLVATMITGRQTGAGPDVVKRNRVWLGLIIAVAVAGYWVYAWQHAHPAR